MSDIFVVRIFNTLFQLAPLFLVVCVIICGEVHAAGATYYVDFNGGNYSNAGTSTSAPWKFSPGDTRASANSSMSK